MFITSQKRTSAELATEFTPHSIETGMRLISDKTSCAVGAPPRMKIEFSGLV